MFRQLSSSREASAVATLTVTLAFCVVLLGSTDLFAQSGQDRRCRHILVDTEQMADWLMGRIREGQDFAALARKYSYDVVTKPLGGELGWIGSSYDPEFNRAAYGIADVGGIAKCRSRYGWHVIQLEELRGVAQRPPVVPPADPATTKPRQPLDQPVRTPDRRPVNRDLSVSLELEDAAVAPGDRVGLRISFTNNSAERQQVFNPDFWPLGLTVRYQFGRLNIPVTMNAESAPADGFLREIGPRETLTRSFVLQEYTGELEPWTLIRMNWRANIYFLQLEKLFPAVMDVDGYGAIKADWKYYASGEEQRLSILPTYDRGQRWFLMLHARGRIWVELDNNAATGCFIDLVRQHTYDRQPFLAFEPERYIHAGGVNDDGTGHPQVLCQVKPETGREFGRGVFALELVRDAGQLRVGSRYYLTLGEEHGLAGRAYPMGRILLKEPETAATIEHLTTNYRVRGMEPRTMLGLIYPFEMLPESVQVVAERESPTALGGSPEPASLDKPTGDLPIVEMRTDRGTFRIELFEDDAPNTVANFVSLVERGFYNGLGFHARWSAPDNAGFVQGGNPDPSDPAGGAGYRIPAERTPHRHLLGSVALARGASPDSGSSQFYICLQDQPSFDGYDTVFGRVVGGMEVVRKLEKGSRIVAAKVVSKRGHTYKPRTISGKPARRSAGATRNAGQ